MTITLEPNVAPAYDDAGLMTNADAYAAAEWRWTDGQTPSAWFASRDEAFADAQAKHPDAAIG